MLFKKEKDIEFDFSRADNVGLNKFEKKSELFKDLICGFSFFLLIGIIGNFVFTQFTKEKNPEKLAFENISQSLNHSSSVFIDNHYYLQKTIAEMTEKEMSERIRSKKVSSFASKNEDKIFKKIKTESLIYNKVRVKVLELNGLVYSKDNKSFEFEFNRKINDDYIFFLDDMDARKNEFIDIMNSYKKHSKLKSVRDKENLKDDEYNLLKLEQDYKISSDPQVLERDIERSCDVPLDSIENSENKEKIQQLRSEILEEILKINSLKKSMRSLFDL